jgi:hypothetical protein
VFLGLTQQAATSEKSYRIPFLIRSDTPLKAVELRRGGKVVESMAVTGQVKNAKGSFVLSGECLAQLVPGVTNNVFQLVATNDDGEASTEVTISYFEPPVVFEVIGLPSQVPQAELTIQGRVVFRNADEADRSKHKLKRVRVSVNDFEQRAIAWGSPQGNVVPFTGELWLNQDINHVEIDCPPELHFDGGCKREFTIRCSGPSSPSTLHLFMVGVDLNDPKQAQRLAQKAFKALQAEYQGSQTLQSRVFKQVNLYPAPDGAPQALAAGDVTTGKVRQILTVIRNSIREKKSQSDVVLIYWLGRVPEKDGDKWYLPTESKRGIELDELLAVDDPTPGARIALLDVAPTPAEKLPLSTLNTAHSAILLYQWSQLPAPVSGLLEALERAARDQNTVSLKDFARKAEEMRTKNPAARDFQHNLSPSRPLGGLIVSQK